MTEAAVRTKYMHMDFDVGANTLKLHVQSTWCLAHPTVPSMYHSHSRLFHASRRYNGVSAVIATSYSRPRIPLPVPSSVPFLNFLGVPAWILQACLSFGYAFLSSDMLRSSCGSLIKPRLPLVLSVAFLNFPYWDREPSGWIPTSQHGELLNQVVLGPSYYLQFANCVSA